MEHRGLAWVVVCALVASGAFVPLDAVGAAETPAHEPSHPVAQLSVAASLGAAQPGFARPAVSPADVPSVSTPFTECPAIGNDPSCGVLVQVTGGATNVYVDPSVGPFDGADDTLVGVVNNSSQPLESLNLASDTDIFGFDGDGICSGDYDPWDGSAGCPYGPYGYEGPNTSFSDISPDDSSGVVNFTGGLAPGDTAYFSLEDALTENTVVVNGSPTAAEQGGAPNPSEHFTVCSKGQPVNCATGELWHQFTDVQIPGRGVPLDFTRTYSSADASTNGPLGYGWTDSYDMPLSVDSSGNVTVNQEDGSTVVFANNGDGTFSPPSRVLASLVQNGDGSYTFERFADSIAYNFSAGGVLQSEIDRNGYATTLAYNGGGQLTSVTDPAGRQLTFAYSGAHLSMITDPMGRTVAFSYDGAGDLVRTTDALGRQWNFGYSGHLLTTMTDPLGGTTMSVYDGSDRVISQTDAAGRTMTWAYTGDATSPAGGTTTLTDSHGNVTLYDYTNLELQSVTHADSTAAEATTSYSYDPATLGVTSTTDPDGNVSTNTYDAQGNLLTATDGVGYTTQYSYNSFNEITSKTTPLGDTTSYAYDSNGNLQTVTDPDGNVTTYTYGDGTHPGDVTSVTDPDGRVTTYTYDTQGDRTSVDVSPNGGVNDTTHFVFDLDGAQVCAASANATAASIVCPAAGDPRVADTTTSAYDADGELTSVTDPNGHTTSLAYDADGNKTSVTDPDGHVTTTSYDPIGRPLVVTTGAGSASPSATTTAYDVVPGTGACAASIDGATYCDTTTDANGGITVEYYDARDELIQETRPGGQITQHAYDLAGNDITDTDAAGRTVSYFYDEDNQLIYIEYSDGTTPDVGYSYDPDGRRSSMSDGSGTTSYSFDPDGRLQQTTDGIGNTVSYGYDGLGNLTTLTYPSGRVVTRTYDGTARLVSINDGSGNTTNFTYDADGNLTATIYPNGDTVTSTYDPADEFTATQVAPTGAPSSPLEVIGYTRDAAGLLTQETDSGALSGTTNYAYNANTELTSANTTAYGYDPAGNPTAFGAATQTFNTASELTKATAGSATINYGYNALGDRTTQAASTGTSLYSYDQANRLTSVAVRPTLPTVTALSHTTGPANGGTTLVITGTGLTGTTSVHFGSHSAHFTISSNTKINATAPAGAGTVNVTVTRSVGTSLTSSVDHFTYTGGPSVTGVTPSWIGTTAHPGITVSGVGFTGATKVAFGTHNATHITVSSSTKIIATAPTGTGNVDVRVATPHGTSAVVPEDRFAYSRVAPTVTAITPTSAAATAHATVTILGTGLSSTTSVHFGAVAATSFKIHSDSVLTAVAPTENSAVDITVTNPKGTSHKVAADRFTYLPTTIATYAYNGDGLRTSKQTATGTQAFTWSFDGTTPAMLTDGTLTFINGPAGTPIEQIDGTGHTNYYFHDALGSSRALLSSTGAITGTIQYNAYGATIGTSGTINTPVLYAGAFQDNESGLYYLINRYYDPAIGQFLSVDPALALTNAPYRYVDDNPLNETDPTGQLFGLDSLLGAAIGAVVGTAISTVSYALTCSPNCSTRGYAGAAVGGAVGGAISGACIGTTDGLLATECGAAGGFAGQLVNNAISGEPLGYDLLQSTVAGAAGGYLGTKIFPTQGFLPTNLSNLWDPGINATRWYLNTLTTSGLGALSIGATNALTAPRVTPCI